MIASMHGLHSDADACALNGKIYVTGGFTGTEYLNTVECYNPETNEWSELPNMLSIRSGVCSVGYQGFVYAIGNFSNLLFLISDNFQLKFRWI